MKPSIVLKEGRDHFVRKGHPWIFAEAIEDIIDLPAGAIVNIKNHKDEFLGCAFYNKKSSITLRILSRTDEEINDSFISERIKASINRRKRWATSEHQIQRLAAFEADSLPGLIIDRYGDYIIFQILSAGMEAFRSIIIETLQNINPLGLIERSDEPVRLKEGLEQRKELISGQLPPDNWTVKENGINFKVDLWDGHKTGFYIDQSNNRKKLIELGKQGGHILNCFCYTGGFSMAVIKGGANKVTSVDSSLPALENLEKNFILNDIDPNEHEQIHGDVFELLESFSHNRSFEGIILDPPKFAGRKQHLKKALRAYMELNRLAMELLKPGGWLATFTCSGRVTRDEFQEAIEEASIKSGHIYVIEDILSQSQDHSIRLGFPESLYLKGLLLRRIQ